MNKSSMTEYEKLCMSFWGNREGPYPVAKWPALNELSTHGKLIAVLARKQTTDQQLHSTLAIVDADYRWNSRVEAIEKLGKAYDSLPDSSRRKQKIETWLLWGTPEQQATEKAFDELSESGKLMAVEFTKADSKVQEFLLELTIYLAKQMDWKGYKRFLSEQMDRGLWIPPGELERTVAERLGPLEQKPMVEPRRSA